MRSTLKKHGAYRFGRKVFTLVEVLFIILLQVAGPAAMVQPAAARAAEPAPLAQTASPTIASDKADYSAGSTVTLTGTGWASGETVAIVVNDTIGQTWQHNATVTATAEGTFIDQFSLPSYFVSDYDVTATGQTSGVATTKFTDAPAQANLDQCRNGSAASPNDCKDFGGNTGWVNGNVGASQAHMLEGYSTPFRAVMMNLPTGSPITLIIGYDIRNSSANAYDYLTQYQRLEPHTFFGHPAETVFPTDGVTGFSATTSTFPIPAPSSAGSPVAGQPTASFNSLPAAERVMTLFGGTITAMAYVSQGSLTANQSETQISVTFTPDNPTAVLAWGGHISQCSVWGTTNGTCNSAGGISGSPYHMRLVSWGPSLPNLGNTDRSMAASVVVQPGNLTLAKSLTGGPNGYTGPFTINYDCGTGFIGSVTVSAGSSQTINGIPSGSVCTISETLPTPPTGYTFGTPTFSPSNTVTIGQGTTITVTTNNTLTRDLGSLKLTKSLTGGPAGYTGPFTIHYDCGTGFTGDVTVAAGSSQTVSGIPSGTSCTITEPTLPSPPTGYSFGTPTFSPSNVVTIGSGTTVEVTTNNTLTRNTGTLTIAKTVSNPDGATLPASFMVNYDCGTGYTGQVSVAPGSPAAVNGIPTGNTCTVNEVAPTPIPGYTWGTITYTPASIVIADTTSTFTITVGNSITRDRGSLTIAKTVSNPDGATLPASFTVNYDCGTGYTGQVSVAPGSPATVNGIPTGSTCTVTEVAPAAIPGYTWGTVTYSPASIVIADTTSTFTITVGNSISRDRGSLEIDKTVSNPDGATLPASFTVNYDCGTGYTGQVSVAPGSPATVNGIPTGSTCTVTEVAPAAIPGYTWGTVTYSPASVVISTNGQTFTITVGNSITRDRGSLEIDKTVSNPDGATLPASFTVSYNCGTGYTGQVSVALGSPATVNGIPTGNTCSVTEVAPAAIPGYTWGTITYSPASVVISTKGQTFTITVGNSITRDRGSLVLAKSLTGGPAGYTGPFTIHWDCGTFGSGDATVSAGGSATVSGIPTGTSCTVSEPTLPTVTGYTFGTPIFSPSATVTIPSGNGSSVTVTTNNTLTRDTGSLKIIKTVSGGTFSGSFSVSVVCTGDGGTYNPSISYPTPGYVTINGIPTGNACTVTEPTFPTPPAGYVWGAPTITGSPTTIRQGATVTVTVNNVLQTGHAQVVKTVGGLPISATNNCTDVSGNIVGCTFQLRQGASTTQVGTILETQSTLVGGQPVGTLNFTTKLTPGQTYQMCEIVMPGWLTSLGTFVPNSFMPPDGVAPNPAVDNSILCGNFVAQADTTTTVGNVFTINNTPPPGGLALTIGFWKNWASCAGSNGGQKPILDETLAKAEPNGIVVSAGSGTYPVFGSPYYLVLHGSTTNKQNAPDCSKAVNLLNKTTIDGKKKMSSDPAFNLAAQLVAAELNYVAGAGKKPAVTTAIQQAVLLLGKYQFNGLTHTAISAADAATMNSLATTLDKYNNNRP